MGLATHEGSQIRGRRKVVYARADIQEHGLVEDGGGIGGPKIGVCCERETIVYVLYGFTELSSVLLRSQVSLGFEGAARVYRSNKHIALGFRFNLDLSCFDLASIAFTDVARSAVNLYAWIAKYDVVLASPADASSMCRKENVSRRLVADFSRLDVRECSEVSIFRIGLKLKKRGRSVYVHGEFINP